MTIDWDKGKDNLPSGGPNFWKSPFYMKLWLMNARVKMFQRCLSEESRMPRFKELEPGNWRPKPSNHLTDTTPQS